LSGKEQSEVIASQPEETEPEMTSQSVTNPPVVRPGEVMCRLDELADPSSKLFVLQFDDGEEVEIFVVRRGDSAHVYLNECPHQAFALGDSGDNFLNLDGSRILCGVHGATFKIDTGEALSGPALPDGCLMKVPVTIVDGEVRLASR
jgi:nitrite reductase/ring-hydroxylating ferredoxin subunit